MQRQQDTSGSRRLWLGLLGVSTLALMAGCGMFDSSTPVQQRKGPARCRPSGRGEQRLPSASSGRQYDAGIAAVDETRTGPQVGSIVAGRGGQKAQKEAIEKEAAERDAKAREQRQARASCRTRSQGAGAGRATRGAGASYHGRGLASGRPNRREWRLHPLPRRPDPPPAPAPAAAPAPEPVAVAAAPSPPADPNKAFVPPPGWAPPGQTAASVAVGTATPPAPAPVTSAPAPVAMAAAATPPPTPMPTPAPEPVVVAAAPVPQGDPNKAFVPPPGWAPPGQTAASVAVGTATPAPLLLLHRHRS